MDSDDDAAGARKEYKAENLHPISVANEKQVMVRIR
jgi:hypothetical protein